MTLEGIDLASHQGPDFDFASQKARGVEFCIIKASGGHEYRNPYLAQQVAGARSNGLTTGYYHYMFEPSYGTPGNPSGGDVNKEVANFIEAVRPYVQPGATFWLDVEEYPKTVGFTGDLAGWLVAFCEAVGAAFGCVCGIYCATWFLVPTGLAKDTRLRKYPFWMASWQEQVPAAKYMAPWDHLTLHQYNADGIDKDRFYGTPAALLALGVPAPSPLPAPDDPIVAESHIGADGVPVTTIRWGGQATEVLGTDYVDVGIRVRNASGQIFHRSIVNGQGQQYVPEG